MAADVDLPVGARTILSYLTDLPPARSRVSRRLKVNGRKMRSVGF
jgi:hypothetical protein